MAKRKSPVVWFELPVEDFARAQAFYRALFGWSFTETAAGGDPYRLIDAGDGIDGGLSLRPAGAHPTGVGPLIYVQVADVEATILKARRLGGALARPVSFLSRETGVVACIRDPDGNTVGLWAAE